MGGKSLGGKTARRLRRGVLTPSWYDSTLDPTHPDGPSRPRREDEEGGVPLEQYAKSRHGKQLYLLHDNGFSLAESQSEMTEAQRVAYLTAKAYWTDKERSESRSKYSNSISSNAHGRRPPRP